MTSPQSAGFSFGQKAAQPPPVQQQQHGQQGGQQHAESPRTAGTTSSQNQQVRDSTATPRAQSPNRGTAPPAQNTVAAGNGSNAYNNNNNNAAQAGKPPAIVTSPLGGHGQQGNGGMSSTASRPSEVRQEQHHYQEPARSGQGQQGYGGASSSTSSRPPEVQPQQRQGQQQQQQQQQPQYQEPARAQTGYTQQGNGGSSSTSSRPPEVQQQGQGQQQQQPYENQPTRGDQYQQGTKSNVINGATPYSTEKGKQAAGNAASPSTGSPWIKNKIEEPMDTGGKGKAGAASSPAGNGRRDESPPRQSNAGMNNGVRRDESEPRQSNAGVNNGGGGRRDELPPRQSNAGVNNGGGRRDESPPRQSNAGVNNGGGRRDESPPRQSNAGMGNGARRDESPPRQSNTGMSNNGHGDARQSFSQSGGSNDAHGRQYEQLPPQHGRNDRPQEHAQQYTGSSHHGTQQHQQQYAGSPHHSTPQQTQQQMRDSTRDGSGGAQKPAPHAQSPGARGMPQQQHGGHDDHDARLKPHAQGQRGMKSGAGSPRGSVASRSHDGRQATSSRGNAQHDEHRRDGGGIGGHGQQEDRQSPGAKGRGQQPQTGPSNNRHDQPEQFQDRHAPNAATSRGGDNGRRAEKPGNQPLAPLNDDPFASGSKQGGQQNNGRKPNGHEQTPDRKDPFGTKSEVKNPFGDFGGDGDDNRKGSSKNDEPRNGNGKGGSQQANNIRREEPFGGNNGGHDGHQVAAQRREDPFGKGNASSSVAPIRREDPHASSGSGSHGGNTKGGRSSDDEDPFSNGHGNGNGAAGKGKATNQQRLGNDHDAHDTRAGNGHSGANGNPPNAQKGHWNNNDAHVEKGRPGAKGNQQGADDHYDAPPNKSRPVNKTNQHASDDHHDERLDKGRPGKGNQQHSSDDPWDSHQAREKGRTGKGNQQNAPEDHRDSHGALSEKGRQGAKKQNFAADVMDDHHGQQPGGKQKFGDTHGGHSNSFGAHDSDEHEDDDPFSGNVNKKPSAHGSSGKQANHLPINGVKGKPQAHHGDSDEDDAFSAMKVSSVKGKAKPVSTSARDLSIDINILKLGASNGEPKGKEKPQPHHGDSEDDDAFGAMKPSSVKGGGKPHQSGNGEPKSKGKPQPHHGESEDDDAFGGIKPSSLKGGGKAHDSSSGGSTGRRKPQPQHGESEDDDAFSNANASGHKVSKPDLKKVGANVKGNPQQQHNDKPFGKSGHGSEAPSARPSTTDKKPTKPNKASDEDPFGDLLSNLGNTDKAQKAGAKKPAASYDSGSEHTEASHRPPAKANGTPGRKQPPPLGTDNKNVGFTKSTEARLNDGASPRKGRVDASPRRDDEHGDPSMSSRRKEERPPLRSDDDTSRVSPLRSKYDDDPRPSPRRSDDERVSPRRNNFDDAPRVSLRRSESVSTPNKDARARRRNRMDADDMISSRLSPQRERRSASSPRRPLDMEDGPFSDRRRSEPGLDRRKEVLLEEYKNLQANLRLEHQGLMMAASPGAGQEVYGNVMSPTLMQPTQLNAPPPAPHYHDNNGRIVMPVQQQAVPMYGSVYQEGNSFAQAYGVHGPTPLGLEDTTQMAQSPYGHESFGNPYPAAQPMSHGPAYHQYPIREVVASPGMASPFGPQSTQHHDAHLMQHPQHSPFPGAESPMYGHHVPAGMPLQHQPFSPVASSPFGPLPPIEHHLLQTPQTLHSPWETQSRYGGMSPNTAGFGAELLDNDDDKATTAALGLPLAGGGWDAHPDTIAGESSRRGRPPLLRVNTIHEEDERHTESASEHPNEGWGSPPKSVASIAPSRKPTELSKRGSMHQPSKATSLRAESTHGFIMKTASEETIQDGLHHNGDMKIDPRMKVVTRELDKGRHVKLMSSRDVHAFDEMARWKAENPENSVLDAMQYFCGVLASADAIAKVLYNVNKFDFILKFKRTKHETSASAAREAFEAKLLQYGLILEFEDHLHEPESTFVKIVTPFAVLCREARSSKLRLPLKEPFRSLTEDALPKKPTGIFRHFQYYFDMNTVQKAVFDENKLDRFVFGTYDVHGRDVLSTAVEHPLYVVHNHFFQDRYRLLLAHNLVMQAEIRIMVKKENRTEGLVYMLSKKIYTDAFPPHQETNYVRGDHKKEKSKKSHGHHADEHEQALVRHDSGHRKVVPEETIQDLHEAGDDDVAQMTLRARLIHRSLHGGMFSAAPADMLRNYFGEKVAFYFIYLDFYNSWLLISTIIGLAVFVYGGIRLYIDKKDFLTNWYLLFDNEATPYFALAMALWSVLYLEYWKRRNSYYAHLWGVEHLEESQERRHDFRAVGTKRSSITGKLELYFPQQTRRVRQFVSVLVMIPFIALVVGTVIAQIAFEEYVSTLGWNPHGSSVLVSVIGLVSIQICRRLFQPVSERLNEWENYRTTTQSDRALVAKQWTFEFINIYSHIIYFAFIRNFIGKVDITGLAGEVENASCNQTVCSSDLTLEFLIIFIGDQLVDRIEEFWLPYIIDLCRSRRNHKIWNEKNRQPQHYKDDKKGLHEGMDDDYFQKAVQYGYVTMFVTAFPIAPLFALMNNFFEKKSDSFKFLEVLRRPAPLPAQNIGIWEEVLRICSFIAVTSNGLLVAFSSQAFYDAYLLPNAPDQWTTIRLLFLMMWHFAVYIIWFIIAWMIPDRPEIVNISRQRERYLEEIAIDPNAEVEDESLETDLRGNLSSLVDLSAGV
ncbi:Anoctamin-7 [Irineochytrium annulatum]|nr:Anoctamin-7 [Irineochytrium annulatum]